MTTPTALIILNGHHNATPTRCYDFVLAVDGGLDTALAWQQAGVIGRIDAHLGDFDSATRQACNLDGTPIAQIHTPDQNFTDFDKALQYLHAHGHTHADVFGASGGHMGHFLGNLTALHRHKQMNLRCIDGYGVYYFLPKSAQIPTQNGTTICLYPFATAHNVRTQGLKWQLNGQTLSATGLISTRNQAVGDCVKIEYDAGDLLVFVSDLP